MPKWEKRIGQPSIVINPKWPTPEIEMIQRIALVSNLIVQWYTRATILANIMEQFDVSEKTVDRYIKSAKVYITDKNNETLENEMEIVQARITDVYQWARKQKKRADCSRAIKLHMELKWLEAPKKYKIIPISDEDKEKVDKLLDLNT